MTVLSQIDVQIFHYRHYPEKIILPQKSAIDLFSILCNHKNTYFLPTKILPCSIKETILGRKGINKQKQFNDLNGMFSQNTFIHNSLQVKKKKRVQIAFHERALAAILSSSPSAGNRSLKREREAVLTQPAELGMAQASLVHTSP